MLSRDDIYPPGLRSYPPQTGRLSPIFPFSIYWIGGDITFRWPNAIAHIRGGRDAPYLSGEARFYQEASRVLVVVQVTGLPLSPSGFFAMHIHEGNSCGGPGFSESKMHLNPDGRSHPRHMGDLPPLMSCLRGAFLSFRTDRFRVEDVIGRTLIIHQGPDNFSADFAQTAGKKIACGVIKPNKNGS